MKKSGRPTEYKEEYVSKVDDYISECRDVEIPEGRVRVNLPTVEGFASFIDVSKKSLYNWRDQHEIFLHALEKIEREQHKRLINMGLSGDYNSTIAKLVLSANHGMKERTDITTDEKPLESMKDVDDKTLQNYASDGESGTGKKGTR